MNGEVEMKNDKIMFSVVVPIYNVEECIECCLHSLIHQTYSNIEIILVDDGSKDGCPRICDQYAKLDSRIQVIHKQNGGLSDARNCGLEVAKGKYIVFVDADDYIELDTCEKFYQFAENSYDILIGDAKVEGGNCDLSHIDYTDVVEGKIYLKKALQERKAQDAVWLNIYRREFLKENNLKFKYGILHEDVEFTSRVFLKAKTVFYTQISFYHYIIREGSITTQKNKTKNARDLYNTCLEHEKMAKSIEDEELKKLFLDSLVKAYLSFFQSAKLFQYGKEYIHKDFCVRNSFELTTKLKTGLFVLSPRIYWYVNKLLKSWK